MYSLCKHMTLYYCMIFVQWITLQGYIRFRESGCVEALLKSEQLPEDVVLSGVEGKRHPLNYKERGKKLKVDLDHILSPYITEEDERAYYLKSQAQRKQKFLKRRQNARGRDKVIKNFITFRDQCC